jgi:ketosteroid isomerase-like protein
MAPADVQLVRRIYAAWAADDYETVYAGYHPDIRLNPDPEAWWVGVEEDYIGHDGVRRYMSAVYEAFADYRPEIEEIVDLGDGRVLTLAVEHGRGRGSGAEVLAAKTAHLWTVRDGAAVQVDLFLDRERALAAVGR